MKSYGRGLSQWKQVFQGNVFAFGLVNFITDLSTEMIYPLLPVFFNGLIYDKKLIFLLLLMSSLSFKKTTATMTVGGKA
jgi:hypothetical protein